jgi:putative hemolysin
MATDLLCTAGDAPQHDTLMADQISILILLLLLSGFFSSAETALFSISRNRARHMAKSGRNADVLIKKMKGDPHRLLSTILIGNNIVNVGASALATWVTIRLVPGYAVGIATGIMVLLIVVFGEVFPKSIATRNNILIARMAIYPIYWLSLLFFPAIFILNFIPRITGKIKKTPSVTEEELKTFVDAVKEEGEIKEEERELIHNIFEFDDINASEIMTPRADMFVVEAGEPLDVGAIIKSGFSRIPVIENDIDHISGIIYVKDLLMHLDAGDSPLEPRDIMRSPYFVPENKKIDSLLKQFKKRKNHMAVIVDEHGGVSGIITLEDVIEEIVGEIADETDRVEDLIVEIRPGVWKVLGKTEIDEVNEAIPMNIPDTGEYDTFSGYVLDTIGRIPAAAEEIRIKGFTIVVKSLEGNRIKEYIVHHKADAE